MFSLVDNETPEHIIFKDSNDIFSPSISAVFKLFDQLMIANTPDLYLSEWQMIVRAVQRAPKQSPYFRLMDNINYLQQGLVMMLEDLRGSNNESIDSFQLSKKLPVLAQLQQLQLRITFRGFSLPRGADISTNFQK